MLRAPCVLRVLRRSLTATLHARDDFCSLALRFFCFDVSSSDGKRSAFLAVWSTRARGPADFAALSSVMFVAFVVAGFSDFLRDFRISFVALRAA